MDQPRIIYKQLTFLLSSQRIHVNIKLDFFLVFVFQNTSNVVLSINTFKPLLIYFVLNDLFRTTQKDKKLL